MGTALDFTLEEYIEQITEIVSMLGVHLEYGSNFLEFWRCPKRQSERHPINPAFNPGDCELNAKNAFWVMGFSPDGELIHTQAIKLLNLQGQTLERYLDTNFWNFRSHGYEFERQKTECHLSPQASLINGNITYHGELWMKPGRGVYRGGSLTVLLTRLVLMQAIVQWAPNYLIGLQSPTTSCRGLGVREGYMRAEQKTITWYEKGSAIPMEDWMVWMSLEDAMFNLRLSPDTLYDMFKKNTDPSLPALAQLSA